MDKKIKKLNLQYIFKLSLISLILINYSLKAEVKAPNYDFSLDQLRSFYPGKKLKDIPKVHGNPVELTFDGDIKISKYIIKHVRYIFPIFVQEKDGVIQDFFTRLPTYFLHDVFHQSLINRYKKQDLYLKKEKAAVYIWKNVKGVKITYEGVCTITCFPAYLAGEKVGLGPGKSTLELMQNQVRLMQN